MPRQPDFRPLITSLWFRLVTLGIFGLVFAEALLLAPGKAQGWSYYLATWEVIFEVVVRLVFAALAGIAAGTLCTILVAPILWYFKSSRERLADIFTHAAVVLVVFLNARFALITLRIWSYQVAEHRAIYDIALFAAFYLAFAVALLVPRARKRLISSLDGLLGEKMTRRTAMVTVAGAAGMAAAEFAIAQALRSTGGVLGSHQPKANIVLITFDALCAEDMSLYGYKLPTTPNIDAFASKSTVFTNFYSACTFTTPCIAAILTGGYPSESLVYQLQGHVRGQRADNTLPRSMRAAGFATGAFLSNPFAYYFTRDLKSDYSILPETIFQKGGFQGLWDATTPLHQDSQVGSRVDEYHDLEWAWNSAGRMPANLCMRFRAAASFAHARQILNDLPEGHFFWLHVMTPHHPYLPDEEDRGRFLPASEGRRFQEESELQWRPHYAPDQQSQVDRRRLLYDEFILSADRAFGSFISDLETRGKLQNTTVIVSADHGESFEGGVFRHESPYLTRPVLHIPLIIRTPNQSTSRSIAFTADQTAIAPTILELAGQPKPDWMHGSSLTTWLNNHAQGEGEGQAFSQFLEKNSVFMPARHGNVGLIDGQSGYQYVLNIDTQTGLLRPINEAQFWNLDRSADNPALAKQLRAMICVSISRLGAEIPREPAISQPNCRRLATIPPQLETPSQSDVALADPCPGIALHGVGRVAASFRANNWLRPICATPSSCWDIGVRERPCCTS